MSHLITSRNEWTMPLIREIYSHIEDIALNDLGLDVYQNQIEIISAEQMIDAYASIGLPVNYNHWSFGKEFLTNWTKYQKGKMGLAYEIVINSDPCISYLMEENPAYMQTLVIAHAAFGHNHVFKNNFVFKEWTSAGSIIDYMIFAKNFIRDCEAKYGEEEVERVLDAAHSIALHGVDKRKRKHKKRLREEEAIAEKMKRDEEEQLKMDIILKKTSMKDNEDKNTEEDNDLDLVGDEENLIYFIYKNAPNMPQWKREVLRIVYKIHQYFYPQRQTQTLNEGFATFTHYYILNELEKRGILSPDAQIAWLHAHSNVILQPDYTKNYYSGFNPYALGFAIFKEIKRVCEEPTKEDEEWFPRLVGTDWRKATQEAVADYRDESFIEQFMTPELIRKWRLFSIRFDKKSGIVKDISDEIGYREIRADLARSYNLINALPDIVVRAAHLKKDRTLVLQYRPFEDRALHMGYAEKTMNHIKYLWGYDVRLVQLDDDTELELIKKT